ncbi:MAG TPA: DUF5667 domain-containing protein [Kribbella sp.]|nr:DUF5667 domain-containing protein [Kribbella sp.]
MSDLNRARARAETFAHVVDHGPRHSSRTGDDDPGLATAVELVERLRTVGAVAPRPEFAAELRHRLLEQAAARAATTTPTVVRSSPDDPDEPPNHEDDHAAVTAIRRRPGRRVQLVAGTAALVVLGGGLGSAAAAQQAMPGDPLYGVKRSLENVSTNVGVGDDSKGRRELEHAMTRLTEVRGLVANGGDAATIDDTLEDFSTQARRGVSRLVASYRQDSDQISITVVTTFVTAARQAIGEFAPRLPTESLEAAVEALATLEQLAQHASAACPRCALPAPVRTTGQGTVSGPGADETTTVEPTSPQTTSAAPRQSTSPGQQPTTGGKVTPRPAGPSGSPSDPSSPDLSLPPTTPSLPWPFPTVSLSVPTIDVSGAVETLLPPWR